MLRLYPLREVRYIPNNWAIIAVYNIISHKMFEIWICETKFYLINIIN